MAPAVPRPQPPPQTARHDDPFGVYTPPPPRTPFPLRFGRWPVLVLWRDPHSPPPPPRGPAPEASAAVPPPPPGAPCLSGRAGASGAVPAHPAAVGVPVHGRPPDGVRLGLLLRDRVPHPSGAGPDRKRCAFAVAPAASARVPPPPPLPSRCVVWDRWVYAVWHAQPWGRGPGQRSWEHTFGGWGWGRGHTAAQAQHM